MSRLFSIALIFVMTATLSLPAIGANAVSSGTKTVSRGTPIKLGLLETIGSQRNQTGDTVAFRVSEDVTQDGKVLIAEGAIALGKITKLKSAKSWGRSGELEVKVYSVEAADGTYIPLTSELEEEREHRTGETAGAAIGGAIIIAFPIGLLAGGAIKGKKIVIDRGLVVDVFTDQEIKVKAYSESQARKIKDEYEDAAIDNAIAFTRSYSPEGKTALLEALMLRGNNPDKLVWEASRIDDFSFVIKVTGFSGMYLFKVYPYEDIHEAAKKFDIVTGIDDRSKAIIDDVR